MSGRLVPALQSVFVLVGQRKTGRGLVNGRDQLSVDRGQGRVRDITTPESPADDHSESVGIKVLDIGRGFDDAASDNAGLPPHQLGRAEGVGEDVVVQTRDATEPIKRDRADFIQNVSQRRVLNKSSYLLSLGGLTPTRARTEHLDDGVGGNGGKTVGDGTDGELFHGLLDFLHPNQIVFLCRDTDVGVLVEHLVDGNQVLIPIGMTARA